MQVKMFVCPTEGCESYFGSNNMGDPANHIVGQTGMNFEPRPESAWHSRAACPDCRAKGNKVERVLIVIDVGPAALAAAQQQLTAGTPAEQDAFVDPSAEMGIVG